MNEILKALAPDLTKDFPRSPRETLAGYVIAGRALDKCRAKVAGTLGEYHFDCPLDQQFFGFTGIDAAAFEEKVASGATDAEMAQWIEEHAQKREKQEIIQWNNRLRYMRPVDMEPGVQEFLEGYIAQYIPRNRVVYVWFDVYDIEEQRI